MSGRDRRLGFGFTWQEDIVEEAVVKGIMQTFKTLVLSIEDGI